MCAVECMFTNCFGPKSSVFLQNVYLNTDQPIVGKCDAGMCQIVLLAM